MNRIASAAPYLVSPYIFVWFAFSFLLQHDRLLPGCASHPIGGDHDVTGFERQCTSTGAGNGPTTVFPPSGSQNGGEAPRGALLQFLAAGIDFMHDELEALSIAPRGSG